ncbi:hypothetical protein CONPUDRAFT_115489 [Coniophora puteana RWD-64-598 SS2]|uniref:Uncharacterized protein n=1 Tax=Coniophora puteana (strain RWD-64-598) TaxID=741705 RepID=A0A5M3N6E3_CONPW|nr:uncharacterized protein CONPUDRAFT_115489 [Coniophora puteana RWD-64-598 SS2]EIW86787.1 hypothetical protein CONPUDRAFT_115489 [Coniophora puteana RWD-64-598 SS2]
MDLDNTAEDAVMADTPSGPPQPSLEPQGQQEPIIPASSIPVTPTPPREFRDIQVKVHIRRPERDSWVYLGRGIASHEVIGQSSRVVVRSAGTGKVLVVFGEFSDLQAEKRGNFVVVGSVEGSRVVSWSLNALNNSDTLRLMASIELACYKCKLSLVDPRSHTRNRRRIERVIKDDRRKRHRRRKDQDAMIDAFSKHNLADELEGPPT